MERNKISILGVGWLGKPLAIELLNRGYEIKASTTSTSKLNELKKLSTKPYLIDIDNLNFTDNSFFDAEVLIINIPSKNIAGFKHLIEEIKKSNLRKILFVSSTSVYPNTNGIITEKTPTINSPLAEIEDLFFENTLFQTTILRFGGLFGYDRKPGRFFKNGRIVKSPQGFVNLIHRDDCIQIICKIIENELWNETLNACCDSHPSRKEFYQKETNKLGKKIKFDDNSDNNYKIIDSRKLIDKLNYEFIYSDLMKY